MNATAWTNTGRTGALPMVRYATPEDAEALVRMIGLLAAHHGDHATVSRDSVTADLFASSPWATALVADGDGDLLGYTLLVRAYRAQFARRVMDLHHLFVLAEARGGGVGAALVRAAAREAEAEGCAQLVVGAHPDNHPAHAFFRTLGFEDVPPHGPWFRLRLGMNPWGGGGTGGWLIGSPAAVSWLHAGRLFVSEPDRLGLRKTPG